MADIVSKTVRSRMMSGIRGKNTRPEMIMRRGLHARGFRYRLHAKELAGTPDLVFPKLRAVVLVHGCFWHRHGCSKTTTPGTNREFWETKFRQNVDRDRRDVSKLVEAGWRVGLVWECAIGKAASENLLGEISEFLLGTAIKKEWP